MKSINYLILAFTLYCFAPVMAQDDLLNELETPESETVLPAFKGTRVVILQSTKMRSKGEFDFIFQHRFGTINSGAYELFGLDDAFVRIGGEYAFSDNVNIGMGRSSVDKSYDLFGKFRLTQQSDKSFMNTVLYGSVTYRSSPKKEDDPSVTTNDRFAYTTMALFSRRLNDKLSLQLSPAWVYKNRVNPIENNHSTYAVGVGSRYMISKSVALTAEYYYRMNVPSTSSTHNPLSIGVDIETGGHVFQVHLTNSLYSFERGILTEVQDDFFNGDIRLGFNVTRTFQF